MKQARLKNGQSVTASAQAPTQAICPICGGIVTLRHRHLMNHAGTTYYWRHLRNLNRDCRARVRLGR